MSIAVGIDLGSTFSVVSYVKADGSVEVIPNSEGNRITPSVFAIDDNEQIMVGDLACEYEDIDSQKVVRLVKRNMSDGFSKVYSFNQKQMSPCEISSEIINKLKKDAEEYLGQNITDAVITVPAYFNNSEREATKAAGEMAGLKVLRIINEPTAASLAYGLDKNNDSTILVYDLGGGTFDVTLLKLSDGCDFHVLSTAGDTKLGGADFDSVIEDLIISKLQSDTLTIKSELRNIAEKTKKILSQLKVANIIVQKQSISISREEFESGIDSLLSKTKDCIDQALSDANLSIKDVDEVVFVGGSTRIPYVAQKVEEWLNKKPNKTINPDEAVSIGAAIQASVLSGNSDREVYLLDVTPLSLGIETQGGFMTTMIKRNTQVPAVFNEIFTTAIDNQTEVDVKVFQGERPRVANNHYLGEFKLQNIKLAPRGLPKISVIFEVDANGIVTVKAVDEETKEEKSMVLSGSNISNSDIKQMLMDAEDNKAKDERDRTIKKLTDYLIDCKIQITHLLGSDALDKNDTNELLDLKKSIDNDINTENVELLSSLSESAKDLLEELSDKVHAEAAKMLL